jgi:xanthine dehydrogenase accessory factor
MSELKSIVASFETGREPMALATAVRTVGSTYRKPGARLLLNAGGRIAGSMSSGCLEDEIAGLARPILASATPALHSFDMRPRFGCNGTIDVLIERVLPGNEFLARAAQALQTRSAWKAATIFSSSTRPLGSIAVLGEPPPDEEAFVQTMVPPIRLVVIGEGLENEVLVALAKALGWDTVLTPSPVEVPPPDARTAIIVKAHKFGRDLAALKLLLTLPIPYLGLMGPTRRKQNLLSTLFDEGLLSPNASLSQLFGPAGLDIGAETPAEIAVAVIAEIQAVMAGYAGGLLRDKRGPIHLPMRELKSLET